MAAVIAAVAHGKSQSKASPTDMKNSQSNLIGLQTPQALKPVEKLQLNFRASRHPQRLHRKNLAERLLFESSVLIGTARLINQIMVFALLVGALRLSSDEVTKRGIFADLGEAFEFDWLNSIQSRQEFVNEGLPKLAAKSKEYFTLSSRYFQSGDIGSLMLLRDIASFSAPKPGPVVTLHTPEFSFTAWVRLLPQFTSGYVVRKQAAESGAGQHLSCWGWHLDAARGPSLHYGGHDYFDTSHTLAPQPSGRRQVEVGLPGQGVPLALGEFSMLTMIVSQHTATFYQDRTLLHAEVLPLPRKVTDCFNNGLGVLLGGPAMEVGVVRYHPLALSESSIEELISTGAILADLSTGSDPSYPEETELAGVERALSSSLAAVDSAVEARQPLSEVAMTLKIVADNEAPQPTAPAAPTGRTVVNASEAARADALNNRSYAQLVEGPWRLTRTEGGEEVHRTLRGVPSFYGTGATLMFWYRHMGCNEEFCGVFLFTGRSGGDAGLCWSLWTEDNGMWFDNLLGSPKFQYPQGIVADKFKLQQQAWRHLALTWDEASDLVHYYIDGVRAVTVPWGSAVAAADCPPHPDNFITFGRNYPGYTYGAEVEIYDLRLYVHPLGAPLAESEVLRVAQGPAPALSPRDRCLPVTSALMQDSDWSDTFGHDCAWFHDQRQSYPSVCALEEAAAQCPIACKSRQECLSEASPSVYMSWDRIRRVEASGAAGAICLADDHDPAAVVERCRAWVAAGGAASDPLDPRLEAWLDSYVSARGRRVDLRDCDALAAAIDPHCAFNSSAVRGFTREVRARGGDFTVAFWVKPTAADSLVGGRFVPHLQFYAQLSPPLHNLAWGLWLNANGEARLFSSCARGDRDIYENIEMNAASAGEWTFVAFTRTNSTSPTISSVATNLGRNLEESNLPVCLYDDDMLFSALEVNYNALISPLMLIPGALPFAAVQELYLSNVKDLRLQSGPRASNAFRQTHRRIPLHKADFPPRSVLTAPPILFQTRVDPAAECPFDYGSEYIGDMHRKVQQSKCAPPFVCAPEVLEHPEHTMACPGPAKENGTVFGLAPGEFNDRVGYADFLYSITDNAFLFREGRVMPTSTFITSLTESVSVKLVFFTPKYGITSLMSLSAKFHGAEAAEVEVSLEHYEILDGINLWVYICVQSVVLVSIFIMTLDVIANIKDLILSARRDNRLPPVASVVKQVTDTGTCVMVILFVAWRIPSKVNSAAETTKLVGGLSQIPWDSTEVPLEEKKGVFFTLVVELTGLITTESSLSTFCNVILIVSLLRVIMCTSLHPRLALLTGTLAKATDDLFHASLLIMLLMGCFAGIATWRFGSEIQAFGTFELTMQTQFEMLFGSFPQGWNKSTDLMVYTILYIIILFLLVQNFLLAIIVEAYMKVREDNDELQTEEGFVQDVWTATAGYIKGKRFGWPGPARLSAHVGSWSSKISVGFRELYVTGEFRSMESVGHFLEHYSRFEFLEPEEVKDFYFFQEPSEAERVAHEIMVRLEKQPTLRKEAEAAFEMVTARRKVRRHAQASRGGAAAAGPVSFEPQSFTSPRIRLAAPASGSPASVEASSAQGGGGGAQRRGSAAVRVEDLEGAVGAPAGINLWRLREETEKALRGHGEELVALRTEMAGLNARLEAQHRRTELHFHRLLAAVAAHRPPDLEDPNPSAGAPAHEPSVPPPYPFASSASSAPPLASDPAALDPEIRSLLGTADSVAVHAPGARTRSSAATSTNGGYAHGRAFAA